MISLEKWCNYILIFGLIMLVPSIVYVKFADELCALALMVGVTLDCIFNGNWRRYDLLWALIAIMTFYAVYSLTMVHFNVPAAIFVDWIIELKPYLPFVVFFCVRPHFTSGEKKMINAVSLFNAVLSILMLMVDKHIMRAVMLHPTYCGNIIFISCLFLIYCNLDEEGQLPRKILYTILFFLTLGLLCGRSKYFGLYVFILFFLLIYKPGMMSRFNFKHFITIGVTLALVVVVAWSKFEFYFLTGGAETFDPEVIESFARPVMYATAGLVILEFVPFGSGLASLGSYASEQWYSDLYYYYGINNVYGLSPQESGFICDAFYATLGQFGVVGVILFIWFWIYAFSFVKALIRADGRKFKYLYIISSLIILYLLIESTSGNAFTQSVGMMPMCLFGIIAARGRTFKSEQKSGKRTEFPNRRNLELSTRKI